MIVVIPGNVPAQASDCQSALDFQLETDCLAVWVPGDLKDYFWNMIYLDWYIALICRSNLIDGFSEAKGFVEIFDDESKFSIVPAARECLNHRSELNELHRPHPRDGIQLSRLGI